MKMITVGGRVKSASIGLGDLFRGGNAVEIENIIKQLRKNPHFDLLKSFFPADQARVKQLLNGIGLFRPMLKTDQGMGGNFLPFVIDESIARTDLGSRMIVKEEGVAIPEPHFHFENGALSRISELFHHFNLKETEEILNSIANNNRHAEKGRDPFFFIRPAQINKRIVFGGDVIEKVSLRTNELLQAIVRESNEIEKKYAGSIKGINLLYCQPDVFIMTDGSIKIERINCPDVGFFLQQLKNPHSSILKEIQLIMGEMQKKLYPKMASVLGKNVAIVTRDEVLANDEDVLEQKEIDDISFGLRAEGKRVGIYSLADIDRVPQGNDVILLNLDYRVMSIARLFERHCNGELNCFPNPFFQMVCQRISGLSETEIEPRYFSNFLQLASSHPKTDQALETTSGRLDCILAKKGIDSDILHVDIGHETVPVFRKSMHSWRQLTRRIRRYEKVAKIKIRSLPANAENLLITSETGPRLHFYRFLFVCE